MKRLQTSYRRRGNLVVWIVILGIIVGMVWLVYSFLTKKRTREETLIRYDPPYTLPSPFSEPPTQGTTSPSGRKIVIEGGKKWYVERKIEWHLVRCSRCNGNGYISTNCSYCKGEGRIYDVCRQCLGYGYAFDTSSYDWRNAYGWYNNAWGWWHQYGSSEREGNLRYVKCPECEGVGRTHYKCPYCDIGRVYVTCPACKGTKLAYQPIVFTEYRIAE